MYFEILNLLNNNINNIDQLFIFNKKLSSYFLFFHYIYVKFFKNIFFIFIFNLIFINLLIELMFFLFYLVLIVFIILLNQNIIIIIKMATSVF